MSNWKLELGEYNGNKFVKIWPVDKAGNPYDQKPSLSLGKAKFLAVIENQEQISDMLGLSQQKASEAIEDDLPF